MGGHFVRSCNLLQQSAGQLGSDQVPESAAPWAKCGLPCLLLGCRDEVAHAVGSRHFTFSLLVHSDSSSPMVDWSQNSSILQVSSTNRCQAWANATCSSG